MHTAHRASPDTLTVSTYERRHRRAVLDLLTTSSRTHTHLDWHETGWWLDTTQSPVRLAWLDTALVGIAAVSTPQGSVSWIRLLGVADHAPARRVLHALWDTLCEELPGIGVDTVHLLIMSDWLVPHLSELGFAFEDEIITLRRDSLTFPVIERARNPAIRAAAVSDLERLVTVDSKAFSSPWQLTLQDLRQAIRLAMSCTVALHNDLVVGYQLSTLYQQHGHLARLAVAPEFQGQGIGSALLEALIRQFLKRGVHILTVNTQSTNKRSQALYARYGFERNGYDLAVWTAVP